MGAGGGAGFLASESSLMWAIPSVGLLAADTGLLIHDGTLLFDALFGSAGPPQTYTLTGWYSAYGYFDGSGTIGGTYVGVGTADAEAAMGDAVWNAPGWLALWNLGYNNNTTGAWDDTDFPAPSGGTRVDFQSANYPTLHAFYLLARDIPGSVTTYNPATDQPDYSLPAPALPGRSTAVSALNTELARPEYHTLRLELQHILDPRCSPDPTSSTVTVPSVLPGETPDDYEACLTSLGLSANVATLGATDTDVGDGDVVETVPDEGDVVQPGTSVAVAANPTTAKISQHDDRCDVDDGAGAPGSPGNPPADGTGYPNYQLVPNSPYPAGTDPSGSEPPQTSIPLRWGTKGWGWSHVLRNHAYTEADETQTEAALATDANPMPSWSNQWVFLYFYDVDDGQGGSLQCVRSVPVNYWVNSNATDAGLTGIEGVQNSYTGAYLGGAPGH
jgi:PASTA domain